MPPMTATAPVTCLRCGAFVQGEDAIGRGLGLCGTCVEADPARKDPVWIPVPRRVLWMRLRFMGPWYLLGLGLGLAVAILWAIPESHRNLAPMSLPVLIGLDAAILLFSAMIGFIAIAGPATFILISK